jgi:hypothetical protein
MRLLGGLATICIILAMILCAIAIAVLYYGAIIYVALWLLHHFGVI